MNTIKPAVTAGESCDIVATGPGALERIKALGKSITGRSRILLASISVPVLVACGAEAQDAPKSTLVADASKAVAAAPAEKVTPVKAELETAVDDEWDLGFGDDLEAEKAETAAEKAETARKTSEAEASTAIREAAEGILN